MLEKESERIAVAAAAVAAVAATVVGIIVYLRYMPPPPPPPDHARVTGKVLETATENPIEAATVEILLDDVKVAELKTGSDGAFAVDLPIGNYVGIASATGYTSSQMRIYVLPEEVGRTVKLLPFLLQRTTPVWAAILYTNTGWLVPISVDGETYNVSYYARSPKLPWPVSAGRLVEAPEQVYYSGRPHGLTNIELSIVDRYDVRVWSGTGQNRSMVTFPGQYAAEGYLWRLKAEYAS